MSTIAEVGYVEVGPLKDAWSGLGRIAEILDRVGFAADGATELGDALMSIAAVCEYFGFTFGDEAGDEAADD